MQNSFKKFIPLILAICVLVGQVVFTVPAQALGQPDVSSSVMKSIINESTSQLASGIEEKRITYEDAKGERTELFSVNVDLNNKNTELYAGTPNDGKAYGMQTVRDQANAAIKNGKKVVAGVNADFFDMATGEPQGNVVKNGIEIHQVNRSDESFFGVLKDGTPVIGDQKQYSQIKGNLKQALGAKNILVKNGAINDVRTIGANNEPRTAVGIKKDNTVFFVVIDGRQAPYSDGISMPDLAQLMRDMGAVQATNLDGGGSTTYVSKTAGEDSLSLKNKPSDGTERVVANSWLVVSNSSADHQFAAATVSPDNKTYSPHSSIAFSAKGVDNAGYSAPLPKSGLSWGLADPSLGKIDTNTGVFQSNGKVGQVKVNLSYNGKVVGSTTVEIAVPDEIHFTQKELSLKFNATQELGLVARYKGRDVILHKDDIKWTFDSKMGTIDDQNVFHAGSESASGNVQAALSGSTLSASLSLKVGQLPTVLYDFENGLDDWAPSTAGRGEVSKISLSSYPDGLVRFGNHALKLDYDFSDGNKNATLGVYAGPAASKNIPGMPTAIGMWVYATPEAQGYWLRMYVNDASGTVKPIDLTTQAKGVDWTGWKYVEAAIPSTYQGPFTTFPKQMIRVMSLKSGQPEGGPMTNGSLYIDNVRAVYGANVDDLTSPIIDSINVDDKTYNNAQVNVTAAIHDDKSDPHMTGINWDRNRIWVDGTEYTGAKGHYSYDKDGTFTLSGYRWADGVHHVRVSVQDNFGNETDRDVYFTVKTGNGTQLSLQPKETRATLGGTYQFALTADDLSNVKAATATVNLGKGFPVKSVAFAKSAAGSTYTYDPETGDLKLTIKNEGASKQAGELALITVSVPAATEEGTKLSYRLTSGNVTFASTPGGAFNGSFSVIPDEVPVRAAYQIKVRRLVVGADGIVQVLTSEGKPVSGAEVSMTDTSGQAKTLGKTDDQGQISSSLLTGSVQKFTLTARKDQNYSFPVMTQSFTAQKTAEPSNLLAGATQDPKTEKTFTWMTHPLQGEDKAIMQVATKDAYAAQGGKAFQSFNGTRQLITYTVDSSAIELNRVTATGLKPGTAYVFRVGDGKTWSEVRNFTTLTDSDHLTFNVFGDTQVTDPEGLSDFSTMLTRIEKASVKPDFAIHVGDFTDDQTIFKEADMTSAMFNEHPTFDSLDMIHVLGNHEYQGDDGTKSAAMLGMPNNNGPEANKTGTYSVDYGNMHIAVIGWTDNADTMKKEMDWLRQDMKATKQTWKIIATHQPAYNKNPADAQSMLFHDMLAPVCDELGIDIVFNGHDHSYGRTFPLVANKKASTGTVYIATGHTGDKTYEIQPNDPSVFDVVQKDKNEKVYLTAQVNGNKMELTVEHPDGSVVDQTVLTAHPADKSALKKAVQSAEALKLDDYISDGRDAFQKALSQAQKLLADTNANATAIDAALNDLTRAQAALKKAADKTALATVIKKATGLKLSNYETAGQEAFKTKLKAAQALLADDTLSQDDQKKVDTMTDGLTRAMNVLQPLHNEKDAVDQAEAAVKKAEQSRSQRDVDAARAQVNALPDSTDKTALTQRLEAIKIQADDGQKQDPSPEDPGQQQGSSDGTDGNTGKTNAGQTGSSDQSDHSSSATHQQKTKKSDQKQAKDKKGTSSLPKTGDVIKVWPVWLGSVLILLAAGIIIKRKKTKRF